MNYKEIILADIGNSRVKFKVNDTIIAFDNNSESLVNYLDSIVQEEFEYFYYSSVNKMSENFILENLANKIPNIESAENLLELSPIDFSKIEGMGTDRKLSLIAVHRISELPLVTVNCGTAVTVNLLDEDNKCLGGVIIPGYYLQAKALHIFTSNLPLIEKLENDGFIGQNTEDSIRYGIINSIVGGIISTISHSSLSSVPDIFVSGGYGLIIKERLLCSYPNVIYDENLVMKGLEFLIRYSIKV